MKWILLIIVLIESAFLFQLGVWLFQLKKKQRIDIEQTKKHFGILFKEQKKHHTRIRKVELKNIKDGS